MFLVVELQTSEDGNLTYLATSHPTREEAESKYHLILSAAAVSSVHVHGAVILDEHCAMYGGCSYDH